MTNHTESEQQALARFIVQAIDDEYPTTELPDLYKVVLKAVQRAQWLDKLGGNASDAYCLTDHDGTCISDDPRCMHNSASRQWLDKLGKNTNEVELQLRGLIKELRHAAKSDNFTELFVAGAYSNAAQALEKILEFHKHTVKF